MELVFGVLLVCWGNSISKSVVAAVPSQAHVTINKVNPTLDAKVLQVPKPRSSCHLWWRSSQLVNSAVGKDTATCEYFYLIPPEVQTLLQQKPKGRSRASCWADFWKRRAEIIANICCGRRGCGAVQELLGPWKLFLLTDQFVWKPRNSDCASYVSEWERVP